VAHLDWLYNIFEQHRAEPCIVNRDQPFTYDWLLKSVAQWRAGFTQMQVSPGTIVALQGDFSPQMVAAFLALIDHSAVVVPMSPSAGLQEQEFMAISEVQVALRPSLHELPEVH
jgi:acyl-CoA synthetase (AMP-forming)/AMP-acid ligase II